MRIALGLLIAAGCASSSDQGDPAAVEAAATVDGFGPLGWISCHVALDILSSSGRAAEDGIRETGLGYGLTVFTNGDLLVQCEASLGSRESASDSNYFPSAVQGSQNASCIASVDFPPTEPPDGSVGSVGFWHFELTRGGPQAGYADVDVGHPLDGAKYIFLENDCSALAYKDGWHETSLGELFR